MTLRLSLFRRLLVGLGLLCGLGVGVAWADDAVTLDEYWRRVDALSDALEGETLDVPAARAAVDDLAAVQAVELPGDQVLSINHEDWLADLQRGDWHKENLEAARVRLAALRAARDIQSGAAQAEPEQNLAQLEEVLSRSEFAGATERSRSRSALQRFWDGLRRWFNRWLSRLGGAPGMEQLLTLVAVGVVIGVLVYAFRGAWSQWVAEGSGQKRRKADDEATLTSKEASERAHLRAADGDYRQAVRYLYLSTLLWLDERRLLRYDPALTNREFLRQVAQGVDRAGLHTALSPVVDLFDRVWYGHSPLDSRGYEVYVRQVNRVRQLEGGE